MNLLLTVTFRILISYVRNCQNYFTIFVPLFLSLYLKMWIALVCVFVLINCGFCNKWELVFLGTGACYPSPRHALSSTVLRIESGDAFLFDVGEGTQLQIMKSIIKPSKITKIFITHLHGDHVFGLPGLLATLLSNALQNSTNDLRKPKKGKYPHVINIYGPQGIRSYLIHAHIISDNFYDRYIKVHELRIPPESMPHWPMEMHVMEKVLNDVSKKYKGEAIYVTKNGIWELFNDSSVIIRAALIKHKIPTFGYVISEPDQSGTLNVEKCEEFGVKQGPVFRSIKQGKPFKAKDGRIIDAKEVLGPPIRGRKVTILGDTVNPNAISSLAMNSDVLIHEATFQNNDIQKAIISHHSTPSMAAKFAKRINAGKLVLNHFSQRYQNKDYAYLNNFFSHHKLPMLEAEARQTLKEIDYDCEVVCANELMKMTVDRHIKKQKRAKNYKKNRY